MSPFLLDSIVVLALVAICLFIGIQIGVKRPWLHLKPEPKLVRITVGLVVLISLLTMIALGVIKGHGDAVRDGVISGAWGGALVGAWLTTRKHRKRLSNKGEAFADGLAETIDGALVGAVIGAFLLRAALAWEGAVYGAIIGVVSFLIGRARQVATRSDAPIPYVVRLLVNALTKRARLEKRTGDIKVSVLTAVLEALAGAILGGSAMSLFWAASSWWAGFPIHSN